MPTTDFRAPTIDDVEPGDTVTSLAIGYCQPITITEVTVHEDDPRYATVTYTTALGRSHIRTIDRGTRVTPWEDVELDPYTEWEYAREKADYDD